MGYIGQGPKLAACWEFWSGKKTLLRVTMCADGGGRLGAEGREEH